MKILSYDHPARSMFVAAFLMFAIGATFVVLGRGVQPTGLGYIAGGTFVALGGYFVYAACYYLRGKGTKEDVKAAARTLGRE